MRFGKKNPDDEAIVALYLERNEDAIRQTQTRYGKLCGSIAEKVLGSRAESEELVNDVCLTLWNTIPPEQPQNLRAYLCRIARNLALKRLRYSTQQKRSVEYTISLSELEDVIPDSRLDLEREDLSALLNRFLGTLGADARKVFLRKYWFFDSVKDISVRYGYSENKVNGMLRRTREKLRIFLRKEGYEL